MKAIPKMPILVASAVLTLWLLGSGQLVAGVVTYGYDSLNRLTNVNYGNGAVMSYTYDAAGNRLAYSGVVTNDLNEPSITITSPTSGATFVTTNETVNLGGTASDNIGVSLITWENFGYGVGTASGTTSWQINGIQLQPGANDIWLTAYDFAGNEGYAAITVTYALPVGPAIQTSFSGGSLKLSWPEATAGDFVLQYANSLLPPIFWSNVVATVTTNAGSVNITLPTTNSQRFFRLRN